MAPLNYVYQHPQAVSGIVIVLICATAILLLIRALGQKNETATPTTKVEATIDVDTIEGAMKRVLASQGPASAVMPAPVVFEGGDSEAMNAALREREARIAELQTEIAKLRADIESVQAMSAGAGAGAVSPADDGRINELQAKIEELKGRLQEYEIIEDDIADLSLYKDENARLKHEIKRLRDEFPEAATAVPTHEAEQAAAEVARAEAAMAAAPEVAPAQSEAPASEPEDDVMKQFAAAVQVQKAPPPDADLKVESNPFATASPESAPNSASADDPFAFELDPEKIMSEVSSLSESDDVTSALEESLDTDKLLAEVGSLQGAVEPVQAPQAAAAPIPKPAAPAPAPAVDVKSFDPLAPDMPAVDDLLAEFKETKS